MRAHRACFWPPNWDAASKACRWAGRTDSAARNQVRQCIVDPGELRGTGTNPGVGNIEVRRNGSEVTFAKTAQGDGPWTLALPELDCNTAGQCGEIFDNADYEVIITGKAESDCPDIGDVTLTIPLKQ